MVLNLNFFYYAYARHAMYEAFKLINLSKGDVVLLPEFICRDVLAPINMLEAEPLFYPVDNKLSPRELPIHKKVKAVIAVNYFGFPQDLKIFQEYSLKTGAYLIEDNAHGFLSSDENGNLLGTRGDLGIFSFRKTIYLFNGGGLQINNSSIKKSPNNLEVNNSLLPLNFHIKKIFSIIQSQTGIKIRSWGEAIQRAIRYLKTGSSIPLPDPDSEVMMPDFSGIHQSSIARLNNLNIEKEKKRRVDLFNYLNDKLSNYSITPVFNKLPYHTIPYGFPFYSERPHFLLVKKLANKIGLNCITWPDLPESIQASSSDHYTKLGLVNFLC